MELKAYKRFSADSDQLETKMHLCLGFSAKGFLAMYGAAIHQGSYDHLCCEGDFEPGPGGSNCYYYSGVGGFEKTWLDARDDCADRGAHLLTLRDEMEQTQQLEKIDSIASGTETWLGYHDVDEEGFPKCDGGCESGFTSWAAVSGNDDDRDCAFLDASGPAWEFDYCDVDDTGAAVEKQYVCEQTNVCPEFTYTRDRAEISPSLREGAASSSTPPKVTGLRLSESDRAPAGTPATTSPTPSSTGASRSGSRTRSASTRTSRPSSRASPLATRTTCTASVRASRPPRSSSCSRARATSARSYRTRPSCTRRASS